MTIEKLTEDEAACLQFDAGVNGEKALRIIDQLAELVSAHEADRTTQAYNRVIEVLLELDTLKTQLAAIQSEVEGENGLRASRDAGWALANARAKELKSERRQRHELLSEEKAVSKHWKEQYLELHQKISALQVENDDMRNEPYAQAKTAEARIEKAIHWLVTCRYDVPANILADRARLALEALRGK